MRIDNDIIGIGLLLVMFIVANPINVFEALMGANVLLIVASIIVGAIASCIDAYTTQLFLKETAKTTFEYTQKTFFPVVSGTGTMLLSRLFERMMFDISKTVGKGIVLFSKLINAAVKGSAILSAVLLLIFSFFVKDYRPFIGLWIVLSTISLWAILKTSSFFGLFAQAFMPFRFSEFSRKTKLLITVVCASNIVVWLLYAMMIWALLFAFGKGTSAIAIFLLYPLFMLPAFLPFFTNSIGFVELIGVLSLLILGIPIHVTFLALVVWRAVKTISDFLFPVVLVGRSTKQFR
ncbi:MAG: hypothetical protein J7K68_00645 [Candidatus Diapherotrites archaeon]|nr:hypothetical protein [Candidatus Diapherotrites archaeon]